MALYQLFLRSTDMPAQAKDFAFDDIHHALELPQAQGFDGLGELWRDGNLLCNIEYSARYGFYRIMPAASAAGARPNPATANRQPFPSARRRTR